MAVDTATQEDIMIPLNQEYKMILEYLDNGCSWDKTGYHRTQGKRAVDKVLEYHMSHCLGIIEKTVNKSQKVLWKCPVCNKEMMLLPYKAKQRKYCSYQCFKSVPRKRKPTSEKRKFRMSPEWRRTRKKRISNFGHICPISLETESLDVHHIDSDYSNNEPENLIPLWRPLHRLITTRANYDEFYEARDRAVLLSITKAWIPE